MNISVHTEFDVTQDSIVVLPVIKEYYESSLLGDADKAVVKALIEGESFKKKNGTSLYLPTPCGSAKGIVLVALGEEDVNVQKVREAFGKANGTITSPEPNTVVVDTTVIEPEFRAALVEALILAGYKFDTYKSKDEENKSVELEECILITPAETIVETADAVSQAVTICKSANWARDLGNTPGNDLTPTILADKCRELVKGTDVDITVFGEQDMANMGMDSLLSVGRGSDEESQLIIMNYTHDDAEKTLALVGKGVTFDSGGISLKPGASMEQMKFDMCGSAAVLGAFKALIELEPKVNIVCAVPSVENMPSSKATKPGDIVKAYNGKTIEIYNTDAEGRLILADALSYVAEKYEPEFMVNAATLTGAAIVALGHNLAGVLGTNEECVKSLIEAGTQTHERLWELPILDEHKEMMKGTDADLCNIGPAREAGTITAGAFLSNFVGETKWAHLDIAGTAWGMKGASYIDGKTASGFGVRLLAQWVLNQI